MKFKLLFSILICWHCSIQSGQCQDFIEFDISVAGINIGEMKATQMKSDDKLKIEIQSQVRFWFFTWVEVKFDSESNYHNGFLVHAASNTASNKGDFSSSIYWNKDKYIVNSNAYKFENKTPLPDLIAYSTSKLYFEEPNENDVFLAENFGVISMISKRKDYYEVEVNGNRNKFYYENGLFVKAVMQSPIKNYVVSRKSR